MIQGKVRDIYDCGDDKLIIVATDRISAFDWILPNLIPDKGKVLTGISAFWFNVLNVPHHMLPWTFKHSTFYGRAMLVRRANVIPFECVVRGYLAGSGWKEYRATKSVCGIPLPDGLVESDRLESPIFTPATKAATGHDLNISFEVMANTIGTYTAKALRDRSLSIYEFASSYALTRGLILADTKFEWGFDATTGELLLIDEVLTPDSSRYWAVDTYIPGTSQVSFDKQFVRDWIETTGWDKSSPPPALPDDVISGTRIRYIECFERLVGKPFTDWSNNEAL